MNKNIGRNDPCPCGSGKKYKKCCMDEKKRNKDCFGDQGGSILHGETPEDCLTCDIIDRCHKVTIATSILGINVDLSLLIQNGFEAGWLKPFKEISEEK
jgi:hypothetical protein